VRIEWYRSATVGIFSKSETSILCDPWITDGAFIGSWFHWPPIQGFEFEHLSSQKWDALYISHFHADHFDRKLVSAIARKQPHTRVILPDYRTPWLYRAVKNCGFDENRILVVGNNQQITIKDIKIRVLAADYCNPTICGSSISCIPGLAKHASNDSLAVFESDGRKLLNANDALAVHSVQRLWKTIGNVDLILGHFGGAGPFPQCFTDLGEVEKLKLAETTGMAFVERLANASKSVNARFVMPYAGQYFLGGKLEKLNKFRSVIPISDVMRYLKDSNTAEPVSLSPFSRFDLNSGEISESWIEPSERSKLKYLSEISKIRFPYELDEDPILESHDLKNLLRNALDSVRSEFESSLNSGAVGSESSISIESGDVRLAVNFRPKSATLSEDAEFENHTQIGVDPSLLIRLIKRRKNYKGFTQYHFNQAEIGSHFTWKRKGFYPKETHLLNFMQARV
jgi:UDP-MurNAc hydroxylase